MHSDDGLGQAMALHYADKAGKDALKENTKLRHEVQGLTRRLDELERVVRQILMQPTHRDNP